MRTHLSVSEVARQEGFRPRDVSDLLYRREIPDELCPIVGGRRLIPATLLPRIREALTRRSKEVGSCSA